jgi:hypothetical protein
MKANHALFHRRSLLILVITGLVAFLGSTYLMIFGDDLSSAGNNAFSYSATGHKAFLETLRRSGIPTSISRYQSLEKAGPANLLVLAEPGDDDIGLNILGELKGESVVLVVLPKWHGRPSRRQPTWVDRTALIAEASVSTVLHRVEPAATLVRHYQVARLIENRLGYTPTLEQPQLVRSNLLSPVVATADGILVGEIQIGRAKVWLLTDPDLISNAGLGKDDNASLAVGIVRNLLPAGGSVIFDESIHGFEQPPNLLRTAFELPFVMATIALVLAAGTALLAGITRFGAPRPTEPPLAAGRETLLRNVAGLLEYGRGASAILERYPRLVVADVASLLKAPHTLDESARLAWLDRRAHRLGLATTATELLAGSAVSARLGNHHRAAAELGRRTNQWKREMLHGTRRHAVDQ